MSVSSNVNGMDYVMYRAGQATGIGYSEISRDMPAIGPLAAEASGLFGAAVGTGEELASSTLWNASNGPGPLGEEIASTFRGASYTQKTLSEDTQLYRVYGGKAGKLSPYWSRTESTGSMQASLDSALLPEWGNTASRTSSIIAPKGTEVFEGSAASQTSAIGTRGEYYGGGNQVYIPQVSGDWLI